MGSTRYPLRSLKRAITIPGNPAPEPTSQKVIADLGIKLTYWELSRIFGKKSFDLYREFVFEVYKVFYLFYWCWVGALSHISLIKQACWPPRGPRIHIYISVHRSLACAHTKQPMYNRSSTHSHIETWIGKHVQLQRICSWFVWLYFQSLLCSSPLF